MPAPNPPLADLVPTLPFPNGCLDIDYSSVRLCSLQMFGLDWWVVVVVTCVVTNSDVIFTLFWALFLELFVCFH